MKRIACCLLLALCLISAPRALPEGPARVFSDVRAFDLAYILGGALVTNFNYPSPKGAIARYTGVDLGEAPREVTCRARFDGGGAVALLSCPLGEWSLEGITASAVHAVFAADGYYLGFFEGGVLTDVLTGAYALDLSGETEYTFGFSISGTTITLRLPTGKSVKKRDGRVASCNGPRVIFEHYLTQSDAESLAAPIITYAYARGKSLPAFEDDFSRGDGLPIQAPTGHAYSQFRNE